MDELRQLVEDHNDYGADLYFHTPLSPSVEDLMEDSCAGVRILVGEDWI